MLKQELIKKVCEQTQIDQGKVTSVLDEVIVNQAIPSILQDKLIEKIANDTQIEPKEINMVVTSIFGNLSEQPEIFELISNELVKRCENACNNCYMPELAAQTLTK